MIRSMCCCVFQRRKVRTGKLLVLTVLGLGPGVTSAADFVPLALGSYAHGISPDGLFVAGHNGGQAFRWSQDDGMVGLGPNGHIAFDVSSTGGVVGGGSQGDNVSEAFRWTESAGMQWLGILPGHDNSWAFGISADGHVVAGVSSGSGDGPSRAFRWTPSAGTEELNVLPGDWSSAAAEVSSDGTSIVGTSWSSPTTSEAVRWANGGIQPLGVVAGYDNSQAWGVSADGSVIVGYSDTTTNSHAEAFLWTESGTIEGLGQLPGHTHSAAWDVSGDGSVVVGSSETNTAIQEAFVWTRAAGMQSLKQVLLAAGVGLDGWGLTYARAISDDGTTIVGWGVNPDGDDEAWLARIDVVPEPLLSPWLFVFFTGLLAGRQCRSQRSASTPLMLPRQGRDGSEVVST